MEYAFLMLLLTGALAAPHNVPSPLLPAEPRSLSLSSFNPLETIGSFFGATEEEEVKKPTHEMISLSEFPVWKVHHYSGVDLKPVKGGIVKSAPSTEYVNSAHTTHGDEGESGLSNIHLLSTGLSALSGIRDAISSLRHTITSIPHTILSTLGLSEEAEDITEEEGLPALPEIRDVIQLPEPILKLLPTLPKLPFQLPIKTKSNKKPAIYVVVNRTEEPQTVVYDQQKPPFELPTSYENPKTHYGAPPSTKGHSSVAPSGLVLPLNLPQGDVQDYHKLAVASANALSQFNTVNEAIDAIQTLNDINSLSSIAERSDMEGGFQPSTAGLVLPGSLEEEPTRAGKPVATQRGSSMQPEPVIPSTDSAGHVAASEPVRSASPREFKASQPDPIVIVTPSEE